MLQNRMNFNLSWNNSESYWICVVANDATELHNLEKDIKNSAIDESFAQDGYLAVHAPKNWANNWNALNEALAHNNIINSKIAVLPAVAERPSLDEVMMNLETVDKVNAIARNLWLGEAITQNRILCYFQPIMDRIGHVFGYESFARVKLESGEIVSGAKIIQAAKELNIQHLIDKYLHVLAIKTFADANLQGSLFINFTSGFIQRPEKYLEALTEAVKTYNMLAKRIVLDVSDSENVLDMNQISSVIEFCNSKNYLVALDDINNLSSLQQILASISSKPDFVKLDRKITQNYANAASTREMLNLADIAHKKGCMLIAEGIETEESYKAMLINSVDLFQGYYLGGPTSITELKNKNAN